jgi:hypothetical protein
LTLFSSITFAIAVLGAILGLINTWHAIDRTRVKLRVLPKHAIPVGGMNENLTFCIEVINLSPFAVTIVDVGCFLKGTNERLSYTNPLTFDGGSWPRRLESRSSFTVYGQRPESTYRLRCAYARTSCGITTTGKSAAFNQIAAGKAYWN